MTKSTDEMNENHGDKENNENKKDHESIENNANNVNKINVENRENESNNNIENDEVFENEVAAKNFRTLAGENRNMDNIQDENLQGTEKLNSDHRVDVNLEKKENEENEENDKNEEHLENHNVEMPISSTNKNDQRESEMDDNPIMRFNQKAEEAKKAKEAKEAENAKNQNNEKDEKDEKKAGDAESVQTDIGSPVVEKKQGINVWANRAFFVIGGILAVVFAVAILTTSNKPKKVNNTNTGASEQVAAPTVQSQTDSSNLPLSNQQIANLKKANINQQGNDQAQQEAMMEAAKAAEMRMSAPSNVITNGNASSNALSSSNNKNEAVLGGDGTGDANTAFMAKVSESHAPITNATHIAHLSTTLAQGNIIQASLDTRIASDLPGMVRAVTSSDIYSEDQSTVLIPRGSRLIGQYTNQIAQGQNRIFVVWQRLIRPDGIDIQIASPGTDTLGTAGLAADSIDHHFFQQFGSAILLSVIGAGVANVGVNSSDQYNSGAAYRMAIADSFNQTAKQSLQNTGVIPPTLYVNQGTKISVFIARDLDFYDALHGDGQGNSQATGSLFQGKLN